MNCTNHPDVSQAIVRCSRCMKPFCPNCLVTLGGKPYCADCKTEQVVDIKSGVDSTHLELAGIGRRFGAIFLDGLIIGAPMMILVFVFLMPMALQGQEPPSFFNFAGLLAIPVYIIYEASMLQWRGQTLGKMAVGVRVVTASGAKISAGQAWGLALVRNLFVSFLAIINYLPAFFTKEKTCVHDLAAKTRVMIVRA